jgi:2-phosphosulfolactate phosphatase
MADPIGVFDQSQFDVRCEWGPGAIDALAASDVLVVVDVLSFTTAVDVAVARGASILPYDHRDGRAAEYAAARGAELAATSRWTKDQYSLSPSSLTSVPSGLRLVLPSPNGSLLSFSARSRGCGVIAGCLRNARAVARAAARAGERVAVVCAGERWPDGSLRPAVEDLLGAGAIIEHLPGACSPEAEAARAAYRAAADSLTTMLTGCSSGRELLERGFADDVAIAAELDVSECVPVLAGDAFVDERGTVRHR